MHIDTKELLQYIEIACVAHGLRPKKPGNACRLWDGNTPFVFHPIWCAATIATEQNLPQEIRQRGILVLLYHDVLEDTNQELPKNLPSDVKNCIYAMTFENRSPSWEDIRCLSDEIKLYKLYDKTSNCMDPLRLSQGDAAKRALMMEKLCDEVERIYGKLNITLIARAKLAEITH